MELETSHLRIYLLSPETLAVWPIPINPTCFGQQLPAFSHNGKYLAYWCNRNDYQARLYSILLPDGKPELITAAWEVGPTGLTWSVDDRNFLYSKWMDKTSDELVEVAVAHGTPRRLGLTGTKPAVSPKGDKFAYGSLQVTQGLWHKDLLHSEVPAAEVVPSSRAQYDAQYSPDGKRIAFASMRSGIQGVWISNEDGSNVVQISDPRYISGSPQWSPDGNRIAFDSLTNERWEIYVADLVERKPRKLITNVSYSLRPSWSPDEKWIYFASYASGAEGVYRCPASGGDATLLSKDIHAFNPKESFDGKTVYFCSGVEQAILKQVTLPGQPGTESEVDSSIRVRDSHSWQLTPRGIYFVPAEAPRSVRYFEFTGKHIRTIFEADHSLRTGLSISPDGRWILYSQEGDPSGDIMLVNNFH